MMKKTGEQFIPDQSDLYEIFVNVERYCYAVLHCRNKIVLDAACGCGFGTYFYGLVANKVYAVDRCLEALNYAKSYPNLKEVEFLEKDLEKDLLPEADVCVSIETIEHLENPGFFLKNLKCKELVFGIPMHSKTISPAFHKQDFKTEEDIINFISKYYQIKEWKIQENKWLMGWGEKKNLI